MANENIFRVVFVLGSPGAGKGTQCKKIEEEFGYVHLSAGELLRQERMKMDSPFRDCIDEHCRKGLLIPYHITCTLLRTTMTESKSNKFLIDAFPPDMSNVEGWIESGVSKCMELEFVLFLDCPQEKCSGRILERGAAGSGRDDDDESKLQNRFTIFKNDSVPVIEYFQNKGLVKRVDASRSPEEVYQDVRLLFVTDSAQ